MRSNLIAGANVDRLNIAAGLNELAACGYPATEVERHSVIEHALMRWSRGEEIAAQCGALDKSFHGIDLTSWLRVLAAAKAGATQPTTGDRNAE